jgi:hypothetical protein
MMTMTPAAPLGWSQIDAFFMAHGRSTSATEVAREVVRTSGAARAGGHPLSLRCGATAATVDCSRAELSRLLSALVMHGLSATLRGADVELHVCDGAPSDSSSRRIVLLELRTSITDPGAEATTAASLRPTATALGGSVVVRERMLGGSVLSVRLPGAR